MLHIAKTWRATKPGIEVELTEDQLPLDVRKQILEVFTQAGYKVKTETQKWEYHLEERGTE